MVSIQKTVRVSRAWEAAIAVILALGILPSFTALSVSLSQSLGAAGRYMGPVNFLKIGIPFLCIYLWQKRALLPRWILWFMASIVVVGSISTGIAGIPCAFPPTLMREWFVIVVGMLAGFSFVLLPALHQRRVLMFWLIAIFGSVILDLVFPSSVDWLYAHVFDPNTRAVDFKEIGQRVLTGVYGRQSLAKLMIWMPWLAFSFSLLRRPVSAEKKSREWWGWLLFIAVSAGLCLATTQRGPFLAGLAGILAFVVHQAIQLKNKKIIGIGMALLLLALGATFALVPRDVLETRLKSLVGMKQEGALAESARGNIDFRSRMFWFSLKVARANPFGQACIEEDYFVRHGITHLSHAHNLLLQQFRERGWIWGALHMFLWLWAVFRAWSCRSQFGSALFAGILSIMVVGLFDHPWPVLNHSLILWTFLLLALLKPKPGAKAVVV